MSGRVELFHYVYVILITLLCLPVLVSYGWTFYATITDRSGLNGHIYYYYNIGQMPFAIYNLIVACLAAAYPVLFIIFIIGRKPQKLVKVFWSFLLFAALLIACEIFLGMRFTGKG